MESKKVGMAAKRPTSTPGGAREWGALPDYIRRLLQPRADGVPVALVTSRAALVAGEWMDLEAYRERFEDRHRVEITVTGGHYEL